MLPAAVRGTHPFWELGTDQCGIFRDGTPVGEVVLLSIHERHLLGTGDALVS